ncbi:PaaI family thioesterase [Salinisphaera sp. T31B1]|uniref:PaaI family thioesterase n=1 Tax=Salinisphaera sp. T31B1 TaxID=727963 RepID=UPI0033429044
MSSEYPVSSEWATHADEGFLALVGPVLERRDGDALVLGVATEAKHRNTRGVVQGGMLVTLADRAMGRRARLAIDGGPVATVQLDTHFVSAAEIGEFLQARATLIRLTRSLVFVEATVSVDERLVMTARGLWKRMKDHGRVEPARPPTGGNG